MSVILKPILQNEEERMAFLNKENNRLTDEISGKKEEFSLVISQNERKLTDYNKLIDEKEANNKSLSDDNFNLVQIKNKLESENAIFNEDKKKEIKDIEELRIEKKETIKFISENKEKAEELIASTQKRDAESIRSLSEILIKKSEIEELGEKNKKEKERLVEKEVELKNREDVILQREASLDAKKILLIERENIFTSKELKSVDMNKKTIDELERIQKEREDKISIIEGKNKEKQKELINQSEELNRRKNNLDDREKELLSREQDFIVRDTEAKAKERIIKAKEKLLATQ